MTKSSFPYTLKLSTDEEIKMYLDEIYNTIVIKDIITRRKITSVNVLEDIMKFMFDNIGSLVSATKISNTLCSKGRKISVQTVENYLTYLCESFILYKAERYDIKGKERLSTGVKYYLSDIGLRYYLLGSKKADQGHILENIVYLELLRRGYKIFIGKNNENEIDFVTYNEKGVNYYQVSYSVIEETTLQRELKPLNNIKDHNPKYLLTMDFTPYTSHNGIKQINVLEWLLDK